MPRTHTRNALQEADKLSKIQKDLDEIKDIMHKNIDEVSRALYSTLIML
jgi:hypothetical protein